MKCRVIVERTQSGTVIVDVPDEEWHNTERIQELATDEVSLGCGDWDDWKLEVLDVIPKEEK